ncbi:MAG: 16S rRNA (guanine(527)-N(7))-methyltransferase RsmG [FCB group bacterium]|nr:16S rRNA (guanine(527)-N(7))-methyltransferase RsmG [FCB group bacterium]
MSKNVEKGVDKFIVSCFIDTYDHIPASNNQTFEEIVARFRVYESLIKRWNKRNNIVSRHDVENLWKKHFIPSIKPLETDLIPEKSVCLDAGSGGGFPGFPIAIFRNDIKLTMCDSNRKKTLFLRSSASKLALSNVTVINRRIETIEEKYQIVLSRGMGKPDVVVPLLADKIDDDGKIILWTNKDAAESFDGFRTKSYDIRDGGKLMVITPSN